MQSRYLVESPPSETGTDRKLVCPNNDISQFQGKLAEKDYSFLLQEVRTLFELTSKESIYEFITASLNNFINGSIVLVNSFSEAPDTLRVRAVAGLGTCLDKVVGVLGKHPVELSVPMNDAAREGLASGRLKKVAGGIYELATGAIPRIVCNSLEDILNISSTYAMGMTWCNRIMGGVAIMVRDEIENPTVIETFVDFSAVAIRRWPTTKNKAKRQV